VFPHNPAVTAQAVSASFAVPVCGVMKVVLRPAVWLLASVAMLATACDGDSPSNQGGDSSRGNAPIVLRGGERLGWDQPVVGGAHPSSYNYTMYIDGLPSSLPSVSCSSSGSGFTCSSLLPSMSPGRHNLSLVASQGIASSAPSRSLDVNVVIAATGPAIVSEAKPIAQPRCSGTGPCYRSSELLRSPGVISSPVSVQNGRILFIVDGRQIHSLSPASAAPAVLLDVAPTASRILSLAVPPTGPEVGSLIWVTSTEIRADDARLLTITRYRLVEDTLGEAAVVVSMRIPNVEPRVVVDNDSHIYIATPSNDTGKASVWRLMTDGTTPRSQAGPELSSVNQELKAVALAPEGQLWVSGVDDLGHWQLGHIPSTEADARFQSVAPVLDDRQSPGLEITSLAFTGGAGSGSEPSVLAVANGTLYRASAQGAVLGSMQRLAVSAGTPIEVAADHGGVYLVTSTVSEGSVTYSLVRLIP
jgi:hypothetical protein